MEASQVSSAPVRFVPLSHLVRSRLNVRKQGGTDVDELAALIHSQGLLQNLVGFEQEKKGRKSGQVEIVAGGRRLDALNLLATAELIAPDYPVACKILDEAEGIAISLAENSGREALHPADEFVAFQELVSRGKSVEDVAAAFGVSPVTVRRRLKLANVSPVILELYRNDEADLEQLMALALSDDHALQERIWNNTPRYDRCARTFRRLLTGNAVTVAIDPIAKFVGLEAYEAAGGKVTRDLFSDEDECYLQDTALLKTLAQEKLDGLGEALRTEEGWAWAATPLRLLQGEWGEYTPARMVKRDATSEEQVEIDRLVAEREAVESRIEAVSDDDEEEFSKLDAEYVKLGFELQEVERKLRTVDPSEADIAGAVLSIGYNGEVDIRRGIVRVADREARTTPTPAPAASEEAVTVEGHGREKAAKAVHPERLIRQMTAHRTLALQAKLAADPHVALAVLTHRLVFQTFRELAYREASFAHVSLDFPNLKIDAEDIASSKAAEEMAARREKWLSVLPQSGDQQTMLAWLLEQQDDLLASLLAFCTASSIHTVQSNEQASPECVALARTLRLDMADYWQPTASSYLSQVSKAQIISVVAEAVSTEAAASLTGMKKEQLVQAAEGKLQGTRWLPEVMRS